LRREYEEEDKPAAQGGEKRTLIAGRAWYFSDFSGDFSQIDLAPEGDGQAAQPTVGANQKGRENHFTAIALVGMEPTEPSITGVGDTLVAGRWFQDRDELGIILPEHVAANLGIGRGDLGKMIVVFGRTLPVIGIVDGAGFDKLRDIDGEPLTPVNFSQQRLLEAQKTTEGQVDTLKEYVHWPSDQVVIVPYLFARGLGGAIRSISILAGRGVDPEQEAGAYARRSNLTVLACNGEEVTLFASLDRSKLTGAGQVVIPVLLGFVMVLGAMLGSVYERRREIFVYNSVGLSPTHVASLFLAESTVYALIGAATGYLLGQMVSRMLVMSGLLASLSLNYSAGATVFVTCLTMGIVLVSTLYPARQAFLAAIPEQRRRFEGMEEEEGERGQEDRISLLLPFVATPSSVFAMQAYMQEFLDGVQGVSVGKLAVDNLETGIETQGERTLPVLRFRAWLAPFDLGMSHDAELRIVYHEDRGVYQYHLKAVRHSGDQQNWRRLTPWFILALRKQLLMWRILTPDDQERYRQKSELLFGRSSV